MTLSQNTFSKLLSENCSLKKYILEISVLQDTFLKNTFLKISKLLPQKYINL